MAPATAAAAAVSRASARVVQSVRWRSVPIAPVAVAPEASYKMMLKAAVIADSVSERPGKNSKNGELARGAVAASDPGDDGAPRPSPPPPQRTSC